MARGRKALPDELKALKGNPGKRRLNLDQTNETVAVKLAIPDFLTSKLEREIFKRASDLLGRVNFVRQTDVDGLARWAWYLSKWIGFKKQVDAKKAAVYYETASKHGKMLRTHPIFASLLQIERVMLTHEDRLGLNPASRQTIMRGIFSSVTDPSLFDKPGEKPAATDAAPKVESPLGFLQ